MVWNNSCPFITGLQVAYEHGRDPVLTNAILTNPDQIQNLKKPDPYKDGQMSHVLETIDFMRLETELPVAITDAQGPLNLALSLTGVERLFIWMYEYPEVVHALMEFVTEVLIEWISVQKKHAGQPLNTGAFPHGIILPEFMEGSGLQMTIAFLSPQKCTESLWCRIMVSY